MNMRKLKKQVNAVSPVIATLMLVLVSVAAAGIFFVWQSEWQEDSTESIEDTEIKAELMVGGSSTIYPVNQDVATAFMETYPMYKVEVREGGSDSGIIGAGEGVLDIGSASKDVPSTYWDLYPDLVQTTIGFDGVVPVVAGSNVHGIESINRTTLGAIYAMNGGLMSDVDADIAAWANALDDSTSGYMGDDSGILEWDEIPAIAGSTGSYCTDSTAVIVSDRIPGSGTEECFGDKLMDEVLGGKEFDISGNNILRKDNNDELLDAFGSTPDAIGFMAYGMAKGSSDCTIIRFAEHGGVSDLDSNDCGKPSFAEIADGTWTGSRPLNYITDGKPTGVQAKWIDFVLFAQNNKDFLEANNYVSYISAKNDLPHALQMTLDELKAYQSS